MESLQEGIRAASTFPTRKRGPTSRPPAITAKDIMTTDVLTMRPDQTMAEAIALLAKHKVSGLPVLAPDGTVVGVLSEFDCMKMVATRAFHQEEPGAPILVAELMSSELHTIEPTTDLYTICHRFLTTRVRRLPVLSGNSLVGLVSRRDVLKALQRVTA